MGGRVSTLMWLLLLRTGVFPAGGGHLSLPVTEVGIELLIQWYGLQGVSFLKLDGRNIIF